MNQFIFLKKHYLVNHDGTISCIASDASNEIVVSFIDDLMNESEHYTIETLIALMKEEGFATKSLNLIPAQQVTE